LPCTPRRRTSTDTPHAQLFSAKPSEEIFTRWSPDALFEDPICLAVGARQYKAQWYGLAKAFSGSMTRAWRVESVSKEQIKYVQKQWYKVAGFEKEMIVSGNVEVCGTRMC
jgi:hypothetical protein